MRQGNRTATDVLASVCANVTVYADVIASIIVCGPIGEAKRFMLGKGCRAKRASAAAAPERAGGDGAAGSHLICGVCERVAGGGENKNVRTNREEKRKLAVCGAQRAG